MFDGGGGRERLRQEPAGGPVDVDHHVRGGWMGGVGNDGGADGGNAWLWVIEAKLASGGAALATQAAPSPLLARIVHPSSSGPGDRGR